MVLVSQASRGDELEYQKQGDWGVFRTAIQMQMAGNGTLADESQRNQRMGLRIKYMSHFTALDYGLCEVLSGKGTLI